MLGLNVTPVTPAPSLTHAVAATDSTELSQVLFLANYDTLGLFFAAG
jgi:hypothetical protein